MLRKLTSKVFVFVSGMASKEDLHIYWSNTSPRKRLYFATWAISSIANPSLECHPLVRWTPLAPLAPAAPLLWWEKTYELLSCKLLCLWIPSKKGKQPNSETKRGKHPSNLEEAIGGSLCGIGSRNNPFGLFSMSVAAFFNVGENVFLGFVYFLFQIFHIFEINFLFNEFLVGACRQSSRCFATTGQALQVRTDQPGKCSKCAPTFLV